jgi:tRNA pseudouridine38-40 synthase
MKNKPPRPMRNVKMTIEFDGTNYFGWQSQAKGVTVQDLLEEAIKKILGKRSPVLASGRTDSGVHVMAQVANVRGHFPMDDKTLLRALNSMLPDDIAVKELETVPAEFNALKDAKWKKYRYCIYNSPIRSPLKGRTSWHMISPLDIKAMKKGAKCLLGSHDFASFMGSNSSVIGTKRNIISLDILESDGILQIEITADGFLKQMVRNIVGTLAEMGRGRMKPELMKEILEAKDRRKAGQTAPAHGLFMVEVGY